MKIREIEYALIRSMSANLLKPSFQPFFTGSRVYGMPNENSDYDLVVLFDDNDPLAKILVNNFKTKSGTYRAGDLNLIVLYSEDAYKRWLGARDECLELAPITREQAIEIHKKYRIASYNAG